VNSLWKAPFRIFGQVFIALVSFAVLLFLFSLLALGFGMGLGAGVGEGVAGMAADDGPAYAHIAGNRESQNRLLKLPIDGIILGSPTGDLGPMSWIGITFGYRIKDILEKVAKDDSVKGVFLHLRTPGGTIFGSRAIFDGLKAYRYTTGKPVLAYIEGLSASGGVMAMVGADAIYADYGSLVGSIGVLGNRLTYYDAPTATDGGLLGNGIVTEGGIEHHLIYAGRSKDLGNPFRRATAAEIASLQRGVDNEYDHFVRLVANSRGIDEDFIRTTLGAMVFDNERAEQYGLIDGTLNRDEAVRKLAELAEVGDDYQLVQPRKTGAGLLYQFVAKALGHDTDPVRLSERTIRRELCEGAVQLPLAYYGDPLKLCF